MTPRHAVVWLDHHTARVVQFDDLEFESRKVSEHVHPTARHGSDVRAIHEFFGSLCDATEAIPELLVTGSHTALADFEHYVLKHRPQATPRITGYQTVDHPTDRQLVALARTHFTRRETMQGSPLPR